jgi:sigma-B regulation protein RsbU (phosphoserine phosphatase)
LRSAEHILENLPCGCIVFGSDGIITYVNPAICESLDYMADDLISSELEMILTISSRIFAQTHFFPMLSLQGRVNEIFLNLKSRTGSAVPVMVNVNSTTENGLISYIGTFATVWERQKYEHELILAKKAQDQANLENDALSRIKEEFELKHQQLDSNLSLMRQRAEEYLQIGKVLTHDMQEPIRKIAFFFQSLLVEKRIQQDSSDLRKIDAINRSVSRLRNLTNALFDFVDLTSMKEVPVFLTLADLIREVEIDVKQSLDVKDFTVEVAHLPGFEGKVSQIRRLFVELLKNAVQNRDIQRPLVVQVNAVEIKSNSYQFNTEKYNYTAHIQIEVIDNGIGFESEFESHVFSLSNKLNKNSDGIGLGLTLCKQIVSQHHGSINTSSKPGEGTKFTILMPVHQS